MLSKSRAFGLFTVPKINPRVLRLLCTEIIEPAREASESPELPSWAKSGPASGIEDDDDFVIPSLASWVERHRLSDPRKAVKQILSETEDSSDVENISRILKNKHASPDDAAMALDGLGLDSSNDTVEQVLRRFSSDWVPALGVFKWAKAQTGYERTPKLYNLMVDVLGKCKRFEQMWELVEEMSRLKGYVSLDTMTKAMRRLPRARMYNEAIDVFRGLERFGVSRDVTALNVLVEALVKENSVEHADGVFLEFKELIPPNAQTFNILIHGRCKARRLDDARKMMEDMEKHGFIPDVYSYTCFVEAHVRDKDFRRACAVLNEMKEKGLKPSVVTYTIVMHGLGKAKQIDEAMKIYEKMKENGCVPDATFYNSVIFMLGKAGRLKDSRDVFDDMKVQGVNPNAATYTTMIACACDHSQEETALMLLRQMEENSCRPELETYAPLLKMCCKKRRMRVLYFLLSHMFGNGVSIEVGTYSLLITGLCKSGKLGDACSFFVDMVSKGMVPMDSPYERLTRGLEAQKMVEAKEKIEKLMSQAKQRLC